MDIRCPSCSTLYEFDENLIPEEGIHLRCSACSQAFRVRKTVGAAASTGWFVRRAMTGEMVPVPDLGDVQRAVVERQFAPGDLLSRSGTHWKRLDEVAELEPFFKVAAETRPRRQTLGGAGAAVPTVPSDPGATQSMHARSFAVSPLDPEAAVTGQTLSGATDSGPTRLQRATTTTPGHAAPHIPDAPAATDSGTEGSGPVQVPTGSHGRAPERRSARTPMMGLAGRTDGAIQKDEVRRRTGAKPAVPSTGPPPAPAAPAADTKAAPASKDDWSIGETKSARETAWSIGGVAVGANDTPAGDDLAMSGEWEAASGLRPGRGIGGVLGPVALVALGAVLAVVFLRPDLVGLGGTPPDDDPTTAGAVAEADLDDEAPTADEAASEAAPTEGSGDTDDAVAAAGEGSGDAVAEADANGEPTTDDDAAAADDTEPATEVAEADAPTPTPTPTPAAAAPTPTPTPRPAAAAPTPTPAASGYDGLMARGNELLSTDPSGALEAFSTAADQSNSAEAHVGVARAYEAMGRSDLAAARYERATRQNERYQPAWVGLAAARERTGDTSGAIEAWERVVRIRSTGAAADRAREALTRLHGAQ